MSGPFKGWSIDSAVKSATQRSCAIEVHVAPGCVGVVAVDDGGEAIGAAYFDAGSIDHLVGLLQVAKKDAGLK